MREGALATHRARASQTEAKLRVIIGKLRDGDEVINISMVAAAAEMSREHLSRRYNYLFSDGP
jgi:AraC-like DNA-binding protein